MLPPDSSRAFPTRVLIVLMLAVLLAHLALLQAAPMLLGLRMQASATEPAPTFSTRMLEETAAKPATAAQPVTPVAAPLKSHKVPLAQSKTVRSQPTDRRASSTAAAEQLPAAAQPPPAALEAATPPSPASSDPLSTAVAELPPEAQPLAAAPRPPLPHDSLPAVHSYRLPDPVHLKYRVKANKFPFSLSSELVWQHRGESFEARLQFSAFGQARVQTSRGAITPQGLAPVRFSDKFRTEVAAHFNHAQGKVTFSANTPDVPLLAGAQDRLSVLVQLAAMLAGAPDRYPAATTIAIQTIGPRDADTWLFTVGREETLTLPGGEQATLKLVRNPRQAYDQQVELWLAPALGYLPARIRITETNGDFVDQQWLASEPLI